MTVVIGNNSAAITAVTILLSGLLLFHDRSVGIIYEGRVNLEVDAIENILVKLGETRTSRASTTTTTTIANRSSSRTPTATGIKAMTTNVIVTHVDALRGKIDAQCVFMSRRNSALISPL